MSPATSHLLRVGGSFAGRSTSSWIFYLSLIVLGATATTTTVGVSAHEHGGENIPEGEVVSPDPLDTILWLHIVGMITAFGIIFPIGMVLGMVRNRWHVPLQVFGSVIAAGAYALGHAHGGRQFAPNIHAKFASFLMLLLVVQIALGIYLKLHLEKGFHGMIRRKVVLAHGIVGKAMPVLAWVQMLFGGITALGFCQGGHTGNCAAHFIMGSSFIAYGIVMTILLLAGQGWLRRMGKSPEFWDSLVIASWGMVNTFTEHRWGQEWGHTDIQHTAMGIVWWAAGLLGIWLSRDPTNRQQPRRNLIPGIVILITGYAMSAHPQHNPLSGSVHTVFGYTLMAAGLARIVEIAFVLGDRNEVVVEGKGEVRSWQYLTPYLLVASGFLFQSANQEQLTWMSSIGIDHVSYVLVLYSLAFLLFLFTNALIALYINQRNSNLPKKFTSLEEMELTSSNSSNTLLGGNNPPSHHRRRHGNLYRNEEDQSHFEMEGLISETDSGDEEGPYIIGGRGRRGGAWGKPRKGGEGGEGEGEPEREGDVEMVREGVSMGKRASV